MTGSGKKPLRFTQDPAFLYARARVHWRKERYGEALQLLHLALEQSPDNPQLLLAKARVLSMMGAFDLSRREAARLLALCKNVEEGLFLMGADALAVGDVQGAYAYLWHYVHRFPRGKRIDAAEDLLSQVEGVRSAYGRFRMYSARLRLREAMRDGRWAYAKHLLARLSRRMPEDAELMAYRSLLAAAEGQAVQALRLAKQAYLMEGENLYALSAMAVALTVQGLAPLGGDYLRRAVESVKDLPAAFYVVDIAGKLGAHNLCYPLLRELHQKLPEHLGLMQLLVVACHNVGEKAEALRLVRRIRTLDPDDPVAVALEKHMMGQVGEGIGVPEVPALPYRWTFPPGSGSFLSGLLPQLRVELPRLEELLNRQQGCARLVRWGLHAHAVSDDEVLSLVEVLRQLPSEGSRVLLREALLTHRSPLLKRAALEALSSQGDGELLFYATRKQVSAFSLGYGGGRRKGERHAAH